MLGDNAAEAGLPLTAPPRVSRTAFTVQDGPARCGDRRCDAEQRRPLAHSRGGRSRRGRPGQRAAGKLIDGLIF
jgi:hypothetical protein